MSKPEVIAIFGPTGVGKTAVAVELAESLRERGGRPVAVSCDAIQVYRELEILSGAANRTEQARLEHRLVGVVGVEEEFSAGRFASMARAEIDALIADGQTPIVVGGTGLYMRAALADLDLRPPVPPATRALVEAQIAELGPAAMHAELDPDIGERIHPNDRKRVARPPSCSARARSAGAARRDSGRHAAPSRAPGRPVVDRDELCQRIDARVDAMVAAGAAEEARAAAPRAPRGPPAALGFDELLAGDLEAVKAAHRATRGGR